MSTEENDEDIEAAVSSMIGSLDSILDSMQSTVPLSRQELQICIAVRMVLDLWISTGSRDMDMLDIILGGIKKEILENIEMDNSSP